jgi:putative spermidine/putrescine transport system substrate-binding protein
VTSPRSRSDFRARPRTRSAACGCGLAAAVLALSGCAGAAPGAASGSFTGGGPAATATSAAAFGGMTGLVQAAQQEGVLNVIALPRDWADYGAIIDAFSKKYGIRVDDENPAGSSQQEIVAITGQEGSEAAPDVVDIGGSYAASGAEQGLFAPYTVAEFDEIPPGQADPGGLWANDYGGYVSIGCNAARVSLCPTTFAQLLEPAYRGMVHLDGDPTESNAAFSAVYAAALANGGSLDDIQPGLDFFAKLKRVGNFNSAWATQTDVESGRDAITIDWDYLNAAYVAGARAKGVDWKVSIPAGGVYADYYDQAINKWAPHPAAARLWEEFLYSAEGQNDFLAGHARPVEYTAMLQTGTLDQTVNALLPPVPGAPSFPTPAQIAAAKAVVASGWFKAVAV